mmetsp:Transcript_31013/g.65993  ORF Transcript_31013/g.65993 Transcript_31013/m.65993 type:complete len:228 (+) Transcript_31013:679-1362(+)
MLQVRILEALILCRHVRHLALELVVYPCQLRIDLRVLEVLPLVGTVLLLEARDLHHELQVSHLSDEVCIHCLQLLCLRGEVPHFHIERVRVARTGAAQGNGLGNGALELRSQDPGLGEVATGQGDCPPEPSEAQSGEEEPGCRRRAQEVDILACQLCRKQSEGQQRRGKEQRLRYRPQRGASPLPASARHGTNSPVSLSTIAQGFGLRCARCALRRPFDDGQGFVRI